MTLKWIGCVALLCTAPLAVHAAESETAAAVVAAAAAAADQSAAAEPAGQSGPQFKSMSGMSVLGNNEAPKSLVIVPWKSSQIGDGIGVLNSLDNRPQPVDREVFSRELDYYRIRTGPQSDPAAPVRVGSR
jgi:hypothetical protein